MLIVVDVQQRWLNVTLITVLCLWTIVSVSLELVNVQHDCLLTSYYREKGTAWGWPAPIEVEENLHGSLGECLHL